jgi:MerR family transcriptional regulator/heat shock protein HspR
MYRRTEVARQLRISVYTLQRYEAFGLVQPTRAGRACLYRAEDLPRLRKLRRLTEDLGVNLPGVQIILRLLEQLEHYQPERRAASYPSPAAPPAADNSK